jgi:hypothetical protein
MESPANWKGLFRCSTHADHPHAEVDILIDDDEVTEVTEDMLEALPEEEDLDAFEDVTDSLQPLLGPGSDDEEAPSQDGDWPATYEEHLSRIRHATRDEAGVASLAFLGLGDVRGCEGCAAAIAKAWEDLRFWEPMLELGDNGAFTGHLSDLRKCVALLEANPPPAGHAELGDRWNKARIELRRHLPGVKSAAATDLRWQQKVAQGRRATISFEEVA